MNARSFDDAEGVGVVTQFDVLGTDDELSALGRDMDASGCVEKVLVEASRTLLLILALFLGAWIGWY